MNKDARKRTKSGAKAATARGSSSRSGRPTVGIHIDSTHVYLARWENGALTDYSSAALESQDPEVVVDGLKATMNQFCASPAQEDRWLTVQFDSLHLRHLRIPKVSSDQLNNAVYWALHKELNIDLGEHVIDYIITGETKQAGSTMLQVTAYTVLRDEITAWRDQFKRGGFPLTGITIPFFTYHNLHQTGYMASDDTAALFLHFGESVSEIFLFNQDAIISSREIRIGAQTFEELLEQILDVELGSEYIWRLLSGADPEQVAALAGYEGTLPGAEELAQKLSPPIRRLIRQIEGTLNSTETRIEHVDKIQVAGILGNAPEVLRAIEKQTGMHIQTVDLFDQTRQGSTPGDTPSQQESSRYITAIGLAMSHLDRTPNLLNPSTSKADKREARKSLRTVFVITSLIAAALLGGWFVLGSNAKKLDNAAAQVQKKLTQYPAEIDAEKVTAMANSMVLNAQMASQVLNRNYCTALTGEISRFEHRDIELTAIEIKVDLNKELEPLREAFKGSRSYNTIFIRGRAVGNPALLDARLAEYMVAINESGLFTNMKVVQSTKEMFGDTPILIFTLKMEIVPPRADEEAST